MTTEKTFWQVERQAIVFRQDWTSEALQTLVAELTCVYLERGEAVWSKELATLKTAALTVLRERGVRY